MSAAAYVGAVCGVAEAEAVLDLVPEGLATARAALGWLRQRSAHMGVLPGTSLKVELQLSPAGWTGDITIRKRRFSFGPTDEVVAAATIAAVVGAAPGGEVTAKTAARLGRTLDAILRRLPVEVPTMKRAVDIEKPIEISDCRYEPSVDVEKPRRPVTPQVVRKPRGVMVTQEAAEAACDVCGGAQAIGNRLHGCLCWRDLLSTARVARLHYGWLVTPGPDWGSDGIAAFAEACRG